MKGQLKKLIALLIVTAMCLSCVAMPIEADAGTDRVLTSEDIPDENLYNAILEVGDMDGNGELLLSEVSAISVEITIRQVVNDFTGLELFESIRIAFDKEGEDFTNEELKSMTEKLTAYENVVSLNISSKGINEDVFEDITKMSLDSLSAVFEDEFDFSVINPEDITDKPFYDTVNDFSLVCNEGAAEISLEVFEKFPKLTNLSINTYSEITGFDTELNGLEFLTLEGYISEESVIDLSSNENLYNVQILSHNYDGKATVIIGQNDISHITLKNICFSDSPVECYGLYLYNCDLENMSLDFSGYTNLTALYIHDCGIENITGLENCNLWGLSLRNNNLSNVPDFDMSKFEDPISDLNFSGNNLTKEELIANTPERLHSDVVWLFSNMTRRVTTIKNESFSDVYTEFNTDYFQGILSTFGEEGSIWQRWYTDCNEIVIEKSVLEWASDRNDDVIFEFEYVDELGNRACAIVNLAEALEELNDDCIINFGFGKDESAVDTWNTENVYVDLHKKYGLDPIYVDGVKYGTGWESIAYNVYYDSVIPYKDGQHTVQLIEGVELSDGETYYFIPAGSDPNYEPTAEEGVNSGKQNVFDEKIYNISMDYDTINDMPDGSVVNTSGSWGSCWIDKDIWNLIITKEMTLNVYMLDSSSIYIDGIISLSYDNMSMLSEESSGTSVNFGYDPTWWSRDGLTKHFRCNSDMANNITVKLYVGDIAKNGETVCTVIETGEYISKDKCKRVGYETVEEYTVEAGMIEVPYLANSGDIALINKSDIADTERLELPSGDIIYYEKGDKILSLKGVVIDNIDLRGWDGEITISCDFVYDGSVPSGTFFGFEDRSRDREDELGICLDSNGTSLDLKVFHGGDMAQMVYPVSELAFEEGKEYSFDMTMFYVDEICCASLYFNGDILGTINVEIASEVIMSENGEVVATNGNATNGNASSTMVYGGTGVVGFEISDLNTAYSNESIVGGFFQGYNFTNTELSVYAGNIFDDSETENEGNTGSDNEGNTGSENEGNTGSDDEGNTGSDSEDNTGSDNEGNTGSDDEGDTGSDNEGDTGNSDNVNSKPEEIEEDKIVEPDKAVNVMIEYINNKKDKTVEVISSDAQTIDKKVFESMSKHDKNITFGVTDKDKKLKYSWSFSPKYIKDTNMDINLEIEVKDHHDKAHKKLGKRKDKALYINFKHHGDLPGPATIKTYVGDRYRDGEKIFLYYYDERKDEVLRVGKQPIEVKAGYAEFTISHCSTYFVMEEKQALELNEEQNLKMDENSLENVNFNIISRSESDVSAGNGINMAVVCALILVSLSSVAMFIFMFKKKRANE